MASEWSIQDLVLQSHGVLLQGDLQQRVQGVSTDSRSVQPGELFVALQGERFDGHLFVADALQRGASAVFVHRPVSLAPSASPSLPAVIQVADTERALQDLALAHRRRFAGTVVAITGSNGKTTVKEMTAAVLQTTLSTYKAPGNLNNHIGVPLTLLRLPLTQEAAVFELGMNHFGEIRRLCALTLPHVGVITNVGLAHVGYLGSVEGVAQAKGELFEALDTTGIALVNADDPYILPLRQHVAGRVITFGQSPGADVRGRVETDDGLAGIQCTLFLDNHHWQVRLALPGTHQVMNALAAAAVGVALHIPAPRIVEALQSVQGTYGRLQIRQAPQDITVIDDTYNANPQSMRVALQCLAVAPQTGQHIAVLGDMLELGEAGPVLHAEVGALAAYNKVDHLVVLGGLAQHTAQGARDAGLASAQVHLAATAEEALAVLTTLLRPHDIVLVKGSRGMAMEHLVHALLATPGGQ